MLIDRPLYFARWSQQWGGGVAFVELAAAHPAPTYGRAYRLAFAQLVHAASEENGGHRVSIYEEQLVGAASEIRARGWYRILLPLGFLEGEPMVTLTGDPQELGSRTRPSDSYIQRIRDGLAEVNPELTDAEINQYLSPHLVAS